MPPLRKAAFFMLAPARWLVSRATPKRAKKRTSEWANVHSIAFGGAVAFPAAVVALAVGAWAAGMDLPTWAWLLLGGVGGVVGYYLGVLVLALVFWLHAIPEVKGEKRVLEIQDQIRDPALEEKRTRTVHRLRHLGGHGELPGPVEEWKGFDAEVEGIEVELLRPVRARLIGAGQTHLANQVVISGSGLDATDLSAEVDRALGPVLQWQAPWLPEGHPLGSPPPPPFRLGKRAEGIDKRLPKTIESGKELSRDIARAGGDDELRECFRRLKKWDKKTRRLVNRDRGPWAIEFGPKGELDQFPWQDQQQLQNLIDAKINRLKVMAGQEAG
jgi:hypothetical protein